MLTPKEITEILATQNKDKTVVKTGFDSALEGLGIHVKSKLESAS